MKKTEPFVIGAKFEDDIVLDTICKKCGFNKSECVCNAKKELLEPNKHNLYLKHEKRNGKIVTIVGEFFIEAKKMDDILKTLKKKLACGGTYKHPFIEIQGDVKDRVKDILIEIGFRFRK